MSFRTFLSPTCETRELHNDPALRTRYYRNSFSQVVEGLKKMAEKHSMEVREINDTHKEVYLLGNGFDCIVTVAQITPIEAGIDFKMNQFASIGFGRPKERVIQFYEDLKTFLNFKGISLHP